MLVPYPDLPSKSTTTTHTSQQIKKKKKEQILKDKDEEHDNRDRRTRRTITEPAVPKPGICMPILAARIGFITLAWINRYRRVFTSWAIDSIGGM